MSMINVRLTRDELDLLSNLASDQLFRKEFIDSRIPGADANAAELKRGKELVMRLREMTDRAVGITSPRRILARV